MSFGIRKRARRADQFVQIENAFLRDESLSIEARGVGAYLLTHDASFRISATYLGKATGLGRDKLRRVLGELETAGYLIREHQRDGGRFTEDEYSMSDEKAQVGTGDWKTAAANQSPETSTHKKTKENTKSEEGGDGSAAPTEDAGEDGTLPLPGLPAPAKPEQPEPKERTEAQRVVAAYVDGYREQTGADPVKSLIGKVAGQASRLLGEGADFEALRDAAEAMGHTQWTDLATQLTRTLAARKASGPSDKAEDVNEWLKDQWQRASVQEIQKRTGMKWHIPDIPAGLSIEQVREFTRQDRRKWIADNRMKIIETIARRARS